MMRVSLVQHNPAPLSDTVPSTLAGAAQRQVIGIHHHGERLFLRYSVCAGETEHVVCGKIDEDGLITEHNLSPLVAQAAFEQILATRICYRHPHPPKRPSRFPKVEPICDYRGRRRVSSSG
ncbi:hypothetical protein PMI41_00570 [Phyllobacterium sp. YR531]|nr:hypothetical protein PMI41_00570 [Phyllobacterium sp. YR531]